MSSVNSTDSEYLTLSQAAGLAPGRPSANAAWRWCRKGVLARNGQRVRLQHIRVGGRVYATAGWVGNFGRMLAEADSQYFVASESMSALSPPRPRMRRARRSAALPDPRHEAERRAILDRELDKEGV
jgi:hypothetical protein